MGFEQLARMEREAGRVPANDNYFDAAFDQPEAIVKDEGPIGDGVTITAAGQEAARLRREGEKAAMAVWRKRHEKRQRLGDPTADNDGEYWPLMLALTREGDNDSISTVLQYRQLVALCACEPLQGLRVGSGDLSPVHRSTNLSKESVDAIDAASKAGWKGERLPGGELRYKEAKKRKGGTFHLPARHAVATNEETRVRTAPLAMRFSDELLIRQIDAKPVLAEVRAALGLLLDPFEDAVLGGRSYTQIGKAEGFDVKPDVAGKALVKRGILAAEGALFEIERRLRKAERDADRKASLRRAAIAVEKARYLGKVA